MSIRQVMEVIQKEVHRAPDSPGGIALQIDKKGRLIGVVTDGDIRRALLGGVSINDSIDRVINRNPITLNKDLTPEEMLEKLVDEIKKRSKRRLEVIATVDNQGRPYDVFNFFELWRKVEVKTRIISIIGLGYVGLTLALILADLGFKVIGVDSDKAIVENLNRKKSHVHEPGINTLLSRHLNKNFFVRHKFDNNDSDVYIICVGTPVNEKGKVEAEPLKEALLYITKILKRDDLVILRSTVPIGTCRSFVVPILEKKTKMEAGKDFFVSFAPERTLEGDALNELRSLPQIIGGYNKTSTDLTVKIFKSITDQIVLVDSLESAEMVKLLNNVFRDLTFSFANEVALICDKLGLNSFKVIKAANYGYLRSFIPSPSPGVGGYCLTKDPYILIESAKKIRQKARLPRLSREINDKMIDYVFERVSRFIEKNNKNRSKIKIFMMGMAFKGEPETSDMRNSTSLDVFRKLKKRYKNIFVFDPVVKREDLIKNGFKYSSIKNGFSNADCVLLMNNHKSYKDLDIYNLFSKMKKPGLFFDAWHIFDEIIIEPVDGITHQGI